LQTFGLADFHLPQTDSSTGGTLLPRCSPPGTPPRSTDLRPPALKSGSYPLCCTFCLSFVWFLSAQTISSLDSKTRSHVTRTWDYRSNQFSRIPIPIKGQRITREMTTYGLNSVERISKGNTYINPIPN